MRLLYILPLQLLMAMLALRAVQGQAAAPGDPSASASDRAAETSLAERWRAPFAVSSSGEVIPRARREVTVIGADPEILQGLRQRELELGPAAAASADRTEADVAPQVVVEIGGGAAPGQERPSIYRVQPGDRWSEIAARFGLTIEALQQANPGVDPLRIRFGQLLEIPALPAPAATPGGVSHRVERGETLWEIARRYRVPPDAIREANGLGDERLRPGEILTIPVDESRQDRDAPR